MAEPTPARTYEMLKRSLTERLRGFASAYGRTHGIAWVAPLIGVWTIIAPWVVSGHVATAATLWSNVVTGVIAVLLGLGAMSLGMSRTR